MPGKRIAVSEFSPISEAEIQNFSHELERGNDCLADRVQYETDTALILGGFVLADYYGSLNILRRELGQDAGYSGTDEYPAGPLTDTGIAEARHGRRELIDNYTLMLDELADAIDSQADYTDTTEYSRSPGVMFAQEGLGLVSVSMNRSELRGTDGVVVARTRIVYMEVVEPDLTVRKYSVSQQFESSPFHMSAMQSDRHGVTTVPDAVLAFGAQDYLHKVVAATRGYLRERQSQPESTQ